MDLATVARPLSDMQWQACLNSALGRAGFARRQESVDLLEIFTFSFELVGHLCNKAVPASIRNGLWQMMDIASQYTGKNNGDMKQTVGMLIQQATTLQSLFYRLT